MGILEKILSKWTSKPDREPELESSEAYVEMRRLLDETEIADLPALDERVRGSYYLSLPTSEHRWWELPPVRVREFPFELAALAASHSNGYVREAAIVRLAELTTGRELPFLLIRVNDWVAPVRRRALALVEDRLREDFAASWVECLPLLDRLQRQKRADHGPLRERVARFLVRSDVIHHLHAGLESSQQAVRRSAFAWCRTAGPSDKRRSIEIAAASEDPMLRLAATKALPGPFVEPEASVLLDTLAEDPFMAVRREALLAFMTRFAQRDLVRAERFLLDPRPGVRYIAVFYSQIEPGAYRELCARALWGDTERDPAGAIGGLAEHGGPEDLEVIRPFLRHRKSKTRVAALRGVTKLDPNAARTVVWDALENGTPRLSKEAVVLMTRHQSLLNDSVTSSSSLRSGRPHDSPSESSQ